MKEITIKEISEKLGLSQTATKARLYRLDIKPIRLIGNTGIYDPSVVEKIRTVFLSVYCVCSSEKSQINSSSHFAIFAVISVFDKPRLRM